MSTRLGRTVGRLLAALICIAGVEGAGAQTTSTWITAGGGNWDVATNWSPAVVHNNATNIADFSTLALSDDLLISLTNNRAIGGLRFGDTDGTPNMIAIGGGPDNYRYLTGGSAGGTVDIHVAAGMVTISNRMLFSSPNIVRKTGSGTLAFSYSGNTYGTNGGLTMVSGTVAYGTNAASVFGSGMWFAGGTLLYPFGNVGTAHSGGQLFTVGPEGGTLIITNGTASYRWNGVDILRGSGTLAVRGGGLLFVSQNQGTYFTGALDMQENTTLQLGSVSGLNLSQGTVTLNEGTRLRLEGNITSVVARLTGTGMVQSVSANSRLWVGDNGATPFSFMFAGTNNALVHITKTGTSTMVLSGTNGLTGATTVGQGVLLVNGLHTNAGNTVAVHAGATLGGNGTIRAAVTLDGILSPGDGGIGVLTTSNVTWNAGTNWAFQLGAAGVADRLASLGTFVKGAGAGFAFDLQDTGVAGVYTLVTWVASTTFVSGDFSAVNVPPGLTPSFDVNANDLTLTLTSSGGSPLLGVTPASLDFGAVEVGMSSGLVFVVTNSGDALLTGTAVVTGGAPFSVTEGGSFSLAAGEITNVVVAFAPTLPESFADGVLFSTDGGSFTGAVTGLGYLLASATNSSIALSGGLVGMQFGLVSGASYRVQATTNLLDAAGWTDMTLPLTNRSGSTLTFTDTNSPALPTRTYRILSP